MTDKTRAAAPAQPTPPAPERRTDPPFRPRTAADQSDRAAQAAAISAAIARRVRQRRYTL